MTTSIAVVCVNPADPVSVYTSTVVARALDGKDTTGAEAARIWRQSVAAAEEAKAKQSAGQ